MALIFEVGHWRIDTVNHPAFDATILLERKMATMPKKYPAEVRDCAVLMVLDRLTEYPSLYAGMQGAGPEDGRRRRVLAPLGHAVPG